MAERLRCQIVEVANELVARLEVQELPEDFDPGDLWYKQILANIRHEFTNYEGLLHELPLCVDFWDAGGECTAEISLECPLQQEAHDLLKWAANDMAKEVYQKWLEKRSDHEDNCNRTLNEGEKWNELVKQSMSIRLLSKKSTV